MPKSTAMITDMTSVITNGPQAATTANAIAAAGPITDYPGVCKLQLEIMNEALNMLTLVNTVLDGSDPIKTTVGALIDVLDGSGSPSTAVLTDAAAAAVATPTAASVILATRAAGPIQDINGMLEAISVRFRQMKGVLTGLYGLTDNGTDSTNRTLLNNLVLVLV